VSPSSASIRRGGRGKYTVTVTALRGFTGTVNLSVTGLPHPTSGAFNPPSITGSGTSVLTLRVGESAHAATYKLTFSGRSGSLVHSAYAILKIR